MTTRGIRNNNPGNIERGADWQGLMPAAEMTPAQSAEKRFCVFAFPVYGIRAIIRTLRTYQTRYGLSSVSGMIHRWAPPGGTDANHTDAYVRAVATAVGVDPKAPVNIMTAAVARPFIKAMITVENGVQPYSDAVIDEGLRIAEVEGLT